ncbi:MAG: flagellin N-terminal helical domain-containing protein [Polyangia bacterium]
MRVTESRMMQVAGDAVIATRDRAARAASVASSGTKVDVPSDDPAGWAEGRRAEVRKSESSGRGDSMGRARDRLAATDQTLGTIGTSLTRIKELAVQMASGTYSASGRSDAATEITQLRATILAAANATGGQGEYLLSGSQGGVAPFTAAGVYSGDSVLSTVEVGEGQSVQLGVPGTVLTAASGTDLFATIDSLVTALTTNSSAGIQAALIPLDSLVNQVSSARAQSGAQMSALDTADQARTALELHLDDEKTRTLDADAVSAASTLAQAQSALSYARSVAGVIANLIEKNS